MEKLTQEELTGSLANLPGWRLEDGELVREWTFSGFPEAIAFVQQVADLAESRNHHPDIDIRYNRVKLGLVTHDAGGITTLDVDFAGTASELSGARHPSQK